LICAVDVETGIWPLELTGVSVRWPQCLLSVRQLRIWSKSDSGSNSKTYERRWGQMNIAVTTETENVTVSVCVCYGNSDRWTSDYRAETFHSNISSMKFALFNICERYCYVLFYSLRIFSAAIGRCFRSDL